MEREDRPTKECSGENDSRKSHPSDVAPVLILGAGINGAAVARELVLNGIPVVVVDRSDIASGATSRSSRLIHGGLRYLEYGDFGLVRESLEERKRLLQLAPQFVRPLRLHIPVKYRTGGLFQSVLKFFKLSRTGLGTAIASMLPRYRGRGLWLARMGLCLYDFLSRRGALPGHRVYRVTTETVPRVDSGTYHWLCAYWDAQMLYPERFVVALLDDARRIARENGTEFRVLTYHHVERHSGHVSVLAERQPDETGDEPAFEFEPSIIINASGAAGDFTLDELNVASEMLFGGTKGSHFITYHQQLRESIGDDGVYAEADDGRLVFVLPFGKAVLVGTTDEWFEQRPEQAIATEKELDYLLSMVNDVFYDIGLTRDDIGLHYSGVRPLPYTKAGSATSIPRGHWIEINEGGDIATLTLIGGKLTTCRALGEEVTNIVLARLGIERINETRQQVVPGGECYPADEAELNRQWEQLATRFGLTLEQVRSVWQLCGNRFDEIFSEVAGATRENVVGTNLPVSFVMWVIENEWVLCLDDLVERRLMLLFDQNLSVDTLRQLSNYLVKANRLSSDDIEKAIASTTERLREFYGKQLRNSPEINSRMRSVRQGGGA